MIIRLIKMNNVINWFSKGLLHKCYVHKVSLVEWDCEKDKYEYGLLHCYECPECHPELFKSYIEDLKRFDVTTKTLSKRSRR